MARSLLRSTRTGWFERCRESRFTSPRVPRQGSSPAYFRLEAASPLKRRSQGLSCVIGNFHAQFLEGWTGAIPSGYSVNFQVRFLEGRPPVMGAGHSAETRSGSYGGDVSGYSNTSLPLEVPTWALSRLTVHHRIRGKNHERTSTKRLCGSSKRLLRSIKP